MKLERVSLLNPLQENPQGGCCEKAFICQVFNPQKCHHACATNCIVYDIVVYNCFFAESRQAKRHRRGVMFLAVGNYTVR